MSVAALTAALDADADLGAPEIELQLIDANTLLGGHYPQPQPIIENMLVPGATLVHGPAKKGKSWFLLQMATAIDSGAAFLTCTTHRRAVLYVGAEDDEGRFKSRLERLGASGMVKFVSRAALERFSDSLRSALGDEPPTAAIAIERLWSRAGRPSVVILDTQEVFETLLGITHGKQGDSVTRRDYLATSTYDGLAIKNRIAIVLVGHWGEIKSIEKATRNPHECLNTTKSRLAGVTTSITLGPLPNQDAGESSGDMQLSIRSRDLTGGDKALWVKQSSITGAYELIGPVNDVLVTQSQKELLEALIAARKAYGSDHWVTAMELAEELCVSPQAIKQMIARVRRSAKAQGRAPTYAGYTLESKPNKGYRAA